MPLDDIMIENSVRALDTRYGPVVGSARPQKRQSDATSVPDLDGQWQGSGKATTIVKSRPATYSSRARLRHAICL